jgi:flagellar hook-associated protein 2
MKIDGLVSGLQTAELIDSLMKVHAIPQSLLSSKITDRNSIVSNLQSLNTSLQGLFDKAKIASGGNSLARFTPTSSNESVTVTAGEKATAFSTDIVVDAVASAHSIVTAAAGSAAWGGTFTLEGSDGTKTEITAVGSGPHELAKAINASKTGAIATVVPAGQDGAGNPLSRIQITARETGADAAFTLHRGSAADVTDGVSIDVSTEPGASVVAQGADASLRLYAGTVSEQILTSASNTFAVAEGIDVTVTKASTDPVTISVAMDSKAQVESAAAFMKEIAALLTRIDNGSKATVGEQGGKTTLGVFTGDSTVRALRTALASAVQSPVNGLSPSTIGVSFTKEGTLEFDEAKFAQALADDPDLTQAVFGQIAGRVEATASQYSDKYDGMLTQRITGQESEVKSLREQVERWDIRLDQRRSYLERTYAQLEVRLSSLQSQSSWLTSQLAGLAPKSS